MNIQVGDRITYRMLKTGEIRTLIIDGNALIDDFKDKKIVEILKIERPKYEVVEEKKELLTDAEKGFLKQALKFGNYKEETTNGIIKFLIKEGYYIKLYYED